MANSLFDLSAKDLKGAVIPLEPYRGKVVLVVNVASQCGFTPQYAGLEALYRKYKEQGFVVLGFPCNQFGNQEPGSEAQIQSFCEARFGVTFPLFSKVEVNGPNTDPVFEFLKSSKRGLFGTSAIKWNFTKFLVGRDGQVIARYGSVATPESLEGAIERALQAK